MPMTKQRTLDYVELEWGTYVERFNRLPNEEQSKCAHAMGMILAVAELPDDAFLNKDIESWLVDDVVDHDDEYPIPG